MDSALIITISALITVGASGFICYFLYSQIKKLKEEKTDDKSEEILLKWIENMQGNLNNVQSTLNDRLRDVQGVVDNRLRHVQEELHQTSDSLNKRVDENSRSLNTRLDKAAEVIGNVHKELGSMSEIGRGMRDLQDFLKSPKLRGNIGEEVLKDLLSQMIPAENYVLQHKFRSGDIVDALLKVEEGFVCVDAKFPLENFNAMIQKELQTERDQAKREFVRNVKKHIDDIGKKYILPNEGTLDFALMYIPSEAIYYEVVVNNSEELGKYAWNKRVLPVSPNLFYSYLKAILIGLEGKKVESRAREILAAIKSIKEDSGHFGESLRVMSQHLNNAKNKSDEVHRNFEKLSSRIDTLDRMKEIGPEAKIVSIEPAILDPKLVED